MDEDERKGREALASLQVKVDALVSGVIPLTFISLSEDDALKLQSWDAMFDLYSKAAYLLKETYDLLQEIADGK